VTADSTLYFYFSIIAHMCRIEINFSKSSLPIFRFQFLLVHIERAPLQAFIANIEKFFDVLEVEMAEFQH